MGEHHSIATRDLDFARPFFGDAEREAVDAVMAGHWLASGKENEAFEREFAQFVGVPYALCVNSGSSANLIALAALDLPKGARVLTSACGFPATLSPILHLGLVPELVDYDISTHNIDLDQVWSKLPAVDALILAHTMGNPVDLRRIIDVADEMGVPIIEDCCEAIGATLDGRQVGGIGDIGTFSFYPSHQITALGGGGMVTFKEREPWERAKSLRDWGKLATWDGYGRNNTVYSTEVDGMPYFPHYTYANVGWNFKLPEANAAFGRVQLKRLEHIQASRNANHDRIAATLDERLLKVTVPEGARPSWFGVILTLADGGDRYALGNALEALGIRHRPFFAGNITRHGPFKKYKKAYPIADKLMADSVFVGCYCGLSESDLEYIISGIREALDHSQGHT